MKLTKLFVIFCSILFFNSSISTKIDLILPTDSQNLSRSICNIANDVINSKTDTQDILIGNFGGKSQSSTINDIIQCINDETTVVVTDLKDKMSRNDLRKASLFIIAFDMIDGVSIK